MLHMGDFTLKSWHHGICHKIWRLVDYPGELTSLQYSHHYTTLGSNLEETWHQHKGDQCWIYCVVLQMLVCFLVLGPSISALICRHVLDMPLVYLAFFLLFPIIWLPKNMKICIFYSIIEHPKFPGWCESQNNISLLKFLSLLFSNVKTRYLVSKLDSVDNCNHLLLQSTQPGKRRVKGRLNNGDGCCKIRILKNRKCI